MKRILIFLFATFSLAAAAQTKIDPDRQLKPTGYIYEELAKGTYFRNALLGDTLLRAVNDSVFLVKGLSVTAGSSKVSVTPDATDTTLAYTVDVNEANLSVAPSQISAGGATSGQVLKWNGSAWAPADESGGAGGGVTEEPFRDYAVNYMSPVIGATSFSYFGYTTTANTGTRTSRSLSTTDHLSTAKRVGLVSAATAGSNAGERFATLHVLRGGAVNVGGFDATFNFGVAATVSDRVIYVGFTGVTSQMNATANPSASANLLGVGYDATDTEFQLYYNDATGTATKVATGISLTVGSIYRLNIKCLPNASTVDFTFTDLTADVAFTHTASTDLPAATQLLTWQYNIGNKATASAVAIDILTTAVKTTY